MIKFHKIHEDAIIPTRATEGSAGFDLYCLKGFTLQAGEKALLPIGISTEFSSNYCGQIWPRSGVANSHCVDVLGGLIDSDYRGGIGVILINHSLRAFDVAEFTKGDRVAQIVFVNIMTEVAEGDGWTSETTRGVDGFGSTGR